MAKRKLVGWIVIVLTVIVCLVWYAFVYHTPLGLMPLVGVIVAMILGFFAALGERRKPHSSENIDKPEPNPKPRREQPT